MTLKPETIRAALTILESVGRVSAMDFANAYWSGKYTDGRSASRAGTQFLFRLRKLGLVAVYQRRQGFRDIHMVYEVSPDGVQFLSENR